MTDDRLPPERDGRADRSRDDEMDALLRRAAPPGLPDDGFSARVMSSVRAIASASPAREADVAAPASSTSPASPAAAADRAAGPWLTPAEAARRLAGQRDHRRLMRTWTRRGALIGAAATAVAVLAQWQAGVSPAAIDLAPWAGAASWTGLPTWILLAAVTAWWVGRVSQEG